MSCWRSNQLIRLVNVLSGQNEVDACIYVGKVKTVNAFITLLVSLNVTSRNTNGGCSRGLVKASGEYSFSVGFIQFSLSLSLF